MDRTGFYENSLSQEDLDYLANINARNYLEGVKLLYESMQTRKVPQIIGRILVLAVPIMIIFTIIYTNINAGMVFLVILASPTFLAIGCICLYIANADRKEVRSLIKCIEQDISDRQYITKKIIYGSKDNEQIVDRLNKKERESYTGDFVPIKAREARNEMQVYRFNGWRKHRAPFEYGMILEITYLAKSRVIDSINIVNE